MPAMPTSAELLDEAVEYGLDIDLQQVDLAALRDDLAVLRVLSDEVVAYAIAAMNDGHPLLKPAARVPAATLKTMVQVDARLDIIEAKLVEAGVSLPQGGDRA